MGCIPSEFDKKMKDIDAMTTFMRGQQRILEGRVSKLQVNYFDLSEEVSGLRKDGVGDSDYVCSPMFTETESLHF